MHGSSHRGYVLVCPGVVVMLSLHAGARRRERLTELEIYTTKRLTGESALLLPLSLASLVVLLTEPARFDAGFLRALSARAHNPASPFKWLHLEMDNEVPLPADIKVPKGTLEIEESCRPMTTCLRLSCPIEK